MAAPWALDILVSATSTPTALAVISFNKTTDRKFNAVGGKKKNLKIVMQQNKQAREIMKPREKEQGSPLSVQDRKGNRRKETTTWNKSCMEVK